jgi:16S rRNA (uracil1498-N3)-methyltransferase
MQLFYGQPSATGDLIELAEEESRHLSVLRKESGDILNVTDGKGKLFTCTLEKWKGKTALVSISSEELKPRAYNSGVHLYVAPTKQSERMEWMFEKAVECGLNSLTFIITTRTEKARINEERFRKIAVSAMKQSVQFYLPVFNHPVSMKDLSIQGKGLLAHCVDEYRRTKFKTALKDRSSIDTSFIIGPEGDFTPEEIEFLTGLGCTGIELGKTRMRTETAALFCVAGMRAFGDFDIH